MKRRYRLSDDPQYGDYIENFVRAFERGEFHGMDRCPGCGEECEGVCEDCAKEYGIGDETNG